MLCASVHVLMRVRTFACTCKHACHLFMKQNLCIQIGDGIGQKAKNLFDNNIMIACYLNFKKNLVHLSKRKCATRTGSQSMVKRTTWAQGRVSCNSEFHTRSDLQTGFFTLGICRYSFKGAVDASRLAKSQGQRITDRS